MTSWQLLKAPIKKVCEKLKKNEEFRFAHGVFEPGVQKSTVVQHDKKNTTQQGGVLFCIQRFEQGMSEAKKRPSGAFSARLHRRGITIDATCPVPSIVPLPRKRLTFSATGSVSPLSVSRCGNTASESLLLRQIKPPSFDGGFIFYSALSVNWAFLPLLPQHLSCGEDGVANALRAGTEDLAGLHAL